MPAPLEPAGPPSAAPRWLVLAACALAVAVRCWLGPYVADDAYITFRYSENLAAGGGFTYNPPDRVQGTTAPLLALALVLPAALDADLGWTMVALSAMADVATILCGAALLIRGGWPIAAALYALAIALWPGLITYSVSGLETSLYVSLLALGAFCVDGGRARTAGVVLALAALCRPDGALMAALLIAQLWRRSAAAALQAALACAATLLPWALFALAYFHTVIPASVAAKAHTRLSAAESFDAFAIRFLSGPYLLLTPVAIAGAWFLSRRARSVYLPLVVWWVGYAATFVATGAFGPYPWYFVPLLPVYFAAVSAAVEQAARVLPARLVSRAAVAAFLGVALVLGARLPRLRATLDQWSVTREHLYTEVATTVLADQSCTLAATEIGTLGYFYRGRILDLVGLVSPEVTRQPLDRVLADAKPCWLVTYDDLLDPAVLRSEWLRDQYDVAFRRRVGPLRELLVFQRRSTPRIGLRFPPRGDSHGPYL